VNARDQARLAELDGALTNFADQLHPLPGIKDPRRRLVLLLQLIDSLRRVEYPRRLVERRQSPRRADPATVEFFDPVRAAAYHRAQGHHDEACWLIFLFVQLGARPAGRWRFIREIYGRLGEGLWDWSRVSADPKEFGEWIEDHSTELRRSGTGRGFGNHRKYESLSHTARTVESYVSWVGPDGHQALFTRARAEAARGGGDVRRGTFDLLYHSMNLVWRFGRLAKFDYLSMLGKLDLAPIEPGSTYMRGATGPAAGARLLFCGHVLADWSPAQLEELLCELEAALGVGMQALEDAVCNWQKRPDTFTSFRG
jgi:Alpha-glutamyl/putrescinyl thymine pyrophosphorylase clade 3